MKISKVVVQNYRSIESVEVEPSSFSVFVGQNNHGKTNFFEAIEWFYNAKSSKDDIFFKRDTSRIISVEVFYEDVQDADIEKLSSESNKTKISKMLGGSTSFSIVKTSADHKRKFRINGKDIVNPTGLDTAINEFLPKIEYVNTRIRLDDVSKYSTKNPIGAMLSGVLATIIEHSQEYTNFKEQFARLFEDDGSEVRQELDKLGAKVEVYLQKQFPDGTKVKFGVNSPEFGDLLKNFETTVDDGVETKAEDKGDGMQRAIMLSIIQAFADYRKDQVGGGTFLFLIDEAELHLHPSAQRALKKALLDICATDQVFINTHSSVLVVENHESQKIFKVEKESSVTCIYPASDIDKMDIIFDLLGGSPADLLLPRNFIIVEGKSDYSFIRTIVERFYQDEYKGIKILFSGGDIDEQKPSLLAVHKLFAPLAGKENPNPIYRDRAIMLIDKPNTKQQSKYDLFRKGYPYLFDQGQVKELPVESLEEYYPEPYKKRKGEIDDDKKVEYAKTVAGEITKEVFEKEMSLVHDALEAANKKAFK